MPAGAQWDTCLPRGELWDTGEDAGAGCLGEPSRRRCGWRAVSYPCVRQQLLLSFCLEELPPCTEARRIFGLCEGLALARSWLRVRWFLLSSEWCARASPPFPLLRSKDYMGTLLVHYVACYPASNLNSFTVTAFREQWYSLQLRLARSSSKLLKPKPPQNPRINWKWWCLFHVFNKNKIKFW